MARSTPARPRPPSNEQIARYWRGSTQEETSERFADAVLDLMADGRLTPARVGAIANRLPWEEVPGFLEELEYLATDQFYPVQIDGEPEGDDLAEEGTDEPLETSLRAKLFVLVAAGEVAEIEELLSTVETSGALAGAAIESGFADASSRVLILPIPLPLSILDGIKVQALYDLTAAAATAAMGEELAPEATGELSLALHGLAAGGSPAKREPGSPTEATVGLRLLLGVRFSVEEEDDGLSLQEDSVDAADEETPAEGGEADADDIGSPDRDEEDIDFPREEEDAADRFLQMTEDWHTCMTPICGDRHLLIEPPVPWSLARSTICRILLDQRLSIAAAMDGSAAEGPKVDRLVLCETTAGMHIAALENGRHLATCVIPHYLLAFDGAEFLDELHETYPTEAVERVEDLPQPPLAH